MSPPKLSASQTKMRVVLTVAILLGLAFNISIAVLNKTGWGVDFNQFYSAGQLTGTGHLYDWDLLRKIEAEHGAEVPTGRLPVVLYGHLPVVLYGHLPVVLYGHKLLGHFRIAQRNLYVCRHRLPPSPFLFLSGRA